MYILRSIASSIVSLYTLLVLLLFLTVADQPLGRWGYLPVNPTVFATLLAAPFVAWALASDLSTRSNRRFLLPIFANRAPLGAFLGIVITSLLYSILPGAFWNEGGKWIFLIAYGFLIALLALFIPQGRKFPTFFRYVAGTALLLLLWSIWRDMTYPGTFTELTQRPAGFPGNANFAALVSVMICAAALDYNTQRRQWQNIVLLITTASIVLITMSRSGALNFAFLVGLFSYARISENGWSSREFFKIVSITALTIGACSGLAVAATLTGTISQHSRLGRLMSNKQVDDGSAASRLFAVKESLRLINEAPLLGHGTGHARTMKELPHNLYLQQWVNNGILGLLSLVGFFSVTFYTFLKRRYRPGQALILVAMLGGVFSHNILDQRCFLLLLGMLLGLSYQRPAIARYS